MNESIFTARFGALCSVWLIGIASLGCSGSPSDSAVVSVAGAPGVGGAVNSGGDASFAGTSFGGSASVANLNVVPTDSTPGGSAGAINLYPSTLPDGFTAADKFGGFKVGAPLLEGGNAGTTSSAGSAATTDGCGTTILAVVRDFKADGKNFEGQIGRDRLLVQAELGADRKPVFAPSGPTLTVQDPAQFADWYRNVDGLNQAFELQIWFAPNRGLSSFQSTQFFPLDGVGFGNEDNPHNYFFTTEIHTRFKYGGGEQFNFTGDDDVWVFINSKLVIDLGGVHEAEDASVDIDARAAELGLVIGQVYPFDMFQNERHTSQSNFRADTTLNFVDCGVVLPEVPR